MRIRIIFAIIQEAYVKTTRIDRMRATMQYFIDKGLFLYSSAHSYPGLLVKRGASVLISV